MSAAAAALVPSIPEGVTLDTTSLYNIWQHALRKDPPPTRTETPAFKTLVNPHYFRMANLVPQDCAPHPLYHPDYANFRTEFLKDYMIPERVEPDDPRMSTPEGLTVTNLNGTPLTFKRDGQGKLSVEGVSVEDTARLPPHDIVTFTLSSFLFDHYERTQAAREDLQRKQPQCNLFGPPARPNAP